VHNNIGYGNTGCSFASHQNTNIRLHDMYVCNYSGTCEEAMREVLVSGAGRGVQAGEVEIRIRLPAMAAELIRS
jgi:hypothetical protein